MNWIILPSELSELSDDELDDELLLELEDEELEDSSSSSAICGTGTGFGRDSKCSRRSSLQKIKSNWNYKLMNNNNYKIDKFDYKELTLILLIQSSWKSWSKTAYFSDRPGEIVPKKLLGKSWKKAQSLIVIFKKDVDKKSRLINKNVF